MTGHELIPRSPSRPSHHTRHARCQHIPHLPLVIYGHRVSQHALRWAVAILTYSALRAFLGTSRPAYWQRHGGAVYTGNNAGVHLGGGIKEDTIRNTTELGRMRTHTPHSIFLTLHAYFLIVIFIWGSILHIILRVRGCRIEHFQSYVTCNT